MRKILLINSIPNKEGNTYRIGEELLKNHCHEVLQMADYKISQYAQVGEEDQIKEVFDRIAQADTLVVGSPVYWYTVSGMLKTFIGKEVTSTVLNRYPHGFGAQGDWISTVDQWLDKELNEA